MNSSFHRNQPLLDSLDQEKQHYSRIRSGHSQSSSSNNPENQQIRHDHLLKNMYRQQLDDLMKQKTQKMQAQKDRQDRQRRQYNERMHYGKQAERMKELSYKNYYQQLLNNQTNISKHYVNPFSERDSMKDRLISNGIQQDRRRSQLWHQQEQKRVQEVKKSYKQDLIGQMQENQFKSAVQNQVKSRSQQDFRKVTLSPHELNKYERERKLMEMQKYKEDLDKSKRQVVSQSSGIASNNDFNMGRLQGRHDLLVNPLPFNIQNPYILKQFRRKEQNLQVNDGLRKSGGGDTRRTLF